MKLVARNREGLPDPVVTMSLAEYSSDPPGITLSVLPDPRTGVTATLGKGATEESFMFKACSMGRTTGKVTLQANIIKWGPSSDYEIEYPAPPERGRLSLTVVYRVTFSQT